MSLTNEDKRWFTGAIASGVNSAITASETRLRSEIERAVGQLEQKIERAVTASETRLRSEIERVETALLTEFHKWASPLEA